MTGKLLIGTSGWNYYDWKGLFYPEALKARDYLAHYARHFRTTEVNYSFYHLPKPTTYENWAAQVPEDFVFAIKASRSITHIRRLRDVMEMWQKFLENASMLEKKLGPILLQFPPSFKRSADLLDNFLEESAKLKEFRRVRLAMEFRHASWYDEETYGILKRHGCALVIAQSERYPQAPYVPAAPFLYVRLHGPGALFASSYSRDQLAEWAARIKEWLTETKSVHVYFNNDFHGYAIENAKMLEGLLLGT
jgi:uncharacterized protein YecE (DUF72 family)